MRHERIQAALAGLFASLSVGLASATDPLPASAQSVAPKIVASPAAPVADQPKPPPGTPVPLDFGKFVWLTVEGHTGSVTFKSSSPNRAFIPPDMPDKAIESDHALGVKQGESGLPQWHKKPSAHSQPCFGMADGTVAIEAWGVLNGKAKQIAQLTLQVGPAPPVVDPVVPTPLTPFQTKLKAAIKADGALPTYVSLYAALYRNAAKTTVPDEGLTTSTALLDEMQRAVKLLGIPAGSLNATARVVADELNTLVPKTNIVLDKPTRDNIASVFTRIAADLEAAK